MTAEATEAMNKFIESCEAMELSEDAICKIIHDVIRYSIIRRVIDSLLVLLIFGICIGAAFIIGFFIKKLADG